jgi:subtilisin family serine protease
MSEKKEYVVISKRGINIEEIDDDLGIETFDPLSGVPERAVEKANNRNGSTRMTHWWLTDEEARFLKYDERILDVSIHPEDDPDIIIEPFASQTGTFYRGNSGSNAQVNWGLRRCIDDTNTYSNNTTISGDYEYALDGSGVDIVIQDTGIEANHPEWEDANGVSRLQQIDWYAESGLPGTQHANHYTDTNGHGTHCAGIAAGKTYGWAKNAHIYSVKAETLVGDGTGIATTDIFDVIRLWHLSKTNGRPTVVNMSWGSGYNKYSDAIAGEYRGTPWTWNGTDTDDDLFDAYGLVSRWFNDGSSYRRIPANNSVFDTEIEEMIDAGIHVSIAAGNSYNVADVSGGAEYNNYATIDGFDYYYHRPGSPYSPEAFYVGNIDSETYLNGTYLDRQSFSSVHGPAVNIWAPGTNITSADSTSSVHTQDDYPDNTSFKITTIGGTSMASPQIVGICALYLQSTPDITPAQLMQKIINDSKSVIQDSGLTVYRHYHSLHGSPNRMVKSRYGVANSISMSSS